MCGIFGIIIKQETNYSTAKISSSLRKLALSSESRGKDSSGVAFRINNENTIKIIKGDIPVRQLISSKKFKNELHRTLTSYSEKNGFVAFGHARLVTNGSQLHEVNNQPVIKDGIVIIHNGIIVNVEEIWDKNPFLKREFLIDTEIIPSSIRYELKKNNLVQACINSLDQIEGTYSIAAMFEDLDQFILATNNGSLYYFTDNKTYFVFASEANYLRNLINEGLFCTKNQIGEIKQITANNNILINLKTIDVVSFSKFKNDFIIPANLSSKKFRIEKHLLENQSSKQEVVIDPAQFINRSKENRLYKLLEYNINAVRKLRRCSKCLLPETFPYIEYDYNGVCNYCNNYKPKNQVKPIKELLSLIEPYRSKNSKPDCVIPFSGGRDSSYTLHFVKQELGLNPIAFTYDWGMVTDLARRNAARVCGKLGVENIIVAADIRMKRRNIQKNVNAWLKKPNLGMVPLFMAGDKYFFYYSNKILSQNNLDLSIWGSNPLENTDFKSGFTGIKPCFDKKMIDDQRLTDKIKLAAFFGKNFICNPSYFNSSLPDTLGSFGSRYLIKRHGFIQLFDFIRWEENEIEKLILNEYNWEKSIDTNSTWRIGDGTAAFYNYIYFTVAGFSEFDTFRSNQIREGQLTREAGLALIEEENIPRYENLRWYLEIIGINYESTIERISKIPKLYNI